MREYLLSAAAVIALLSSGAAAHDKPVTLMEGLGNHHHPIATDKPEAQEFFDQGLILTFAFNHAEAIRAFEKAHELDPSSPMPLWGKALALGPNYNIGVDPVSEKLAFETISEASALAANAPEREKAYVEALKVRYSGDRQSRSQSACAELCRCDGRTVERAIRTISTRRRSMPRA